MNRFPLRARSVSLLLLACAGSLLLAACGASSTPAPADGAVTGEIVVSAGSSLTDVFTSIKTAFEESHPGTKVTLNFGASSALAVQINEGAPVDVFASADTDQMAVVVNAGHASEPVVFATNRLVVVKPAGSTVVNSFEDLGQPGVRLVLAGAAVPIGKYAREALARADASGLYGEGFYTRVIANLRSEEANVRAVLVKAELGEADAAIVYATDAAVAAGQVESLPVPAEAAVPANYPIAVVSNSGHAATAAAFVAFVRGTGGQTILRAAGFGAAPRG